MFQRRDKIAVFGFPRRGGGALVPIRGKDIYVWAQAHNDFSSTRGGNDGASGADWDHAILTMTEALARAKTGDRIFVAGKITEECTGSNLVFDLTIQGVGSLHHADQPGSGTSLYDYGASIWQPPSSPTATTPLLKIRGRGWKIYDMMFDCPVDSAALYLERNASSGTDEYDPSHLTVRGSRFVDGKYAIQDVGGCYNVTIDDCEAKNISTCAIANTSTAVANPLNWKIKGFRCPADVGTLGNASHIDSPLNGSYIWDSFFGTVDSTALYVDLTGGNSNIVTRNYMMGSYDTSDYVAGTGDGWSGNITADISGNSAVDASGLTIAVPAAP